MKMIVARHSLLRVYLISSAVIWKYLGTLAGLERRWPRRSSSTMHNIASSSRLAILAQSSPRLLTYFQNTALVLSWGRVFFQRPQLENAGGYSSRPIISINKSAARQGVSARSVSASNSALHAARSEEHTSELQSRPQLVCRLLLAKIYISTTY